MTATYILFYITVSLAIVVMSAVLLVNKGKK
jgi:hypothetical protein